MTEHEAKGLLTNFATKIFHTLGDGDTSEYASSLLGKRRESFISVQPKDDISMGQEIFGSAAMSANYSESYQEVLQPAVFQTGLRSGGPENRFKVDAIVIKSTRFRCGQNWLFATFDQR